MSQKRDRNQDKSEIEHYRGLVRTLEKRVRQLTRQLKYFEKREHILELSEPNEDETIPQEEVKKLIRCKAPKCHTGFYNEYDILDKVIGTCNVCGDRKRLK